jgi:hypothetical protein
VTVPQDLFILAADGGEPVYEDIFEQVVMCLHSAKKSHSFQVT